MKRFWPLLLILILCPFAFIFSSSCEKSSVAEGKSFAEQIMEENSKINQELTYINKNADLNTFAKTLDIEIEQSADFYDNPIDENDMQLKKAIEVIKEK